MRNQRNPTAEEIVGDLMKKNAMKDFKNNSSIPNSRTLALINSKRNNFTKFIDPSRQSLSQIGSRLKDMASKTKIPLNNEKNPMWWNSYRHILKSQISHRRSISAPDFMVEDEVKNQEEIRGDFLTTVDENAPNATDENNGLSFRELFYNELKAMKRK